jgi:hypothetical protein
VRLLKTTIVTTLAVSGILAGLSAQQAGFKRTVLQQRSCPCLVAKL